MEVCKGRMVRKVWSSNPLSPEASVLALKLSSLETAVCVWVHCAFLPRDKVRERNGLRREKRGVKKKTRGEGAYSLHQRGWDLGAGSSQLAVTTGSCDDCNNQ